LLVLVDHEPATFFGDRPHGYFQLFAAIAAQRAEHLSGETLRMDSQQRNASGWIAHDDRERAFDPSGAVRRIALEPDGIEHSPLRGHARGHDAPKRTGLRGAHCLGSEGFDVFPRHLGVSVLSHGRYAARTFAFGIVPLARKPS